MSVCVCVSRSTSRRVLTVEWNVAMWFMADSSPLNTLLSFHSDVSQCCGSRSVSATAERGYASRY